MPKTKNHQTPVESHLNRIVGQMNGVKKMIRNGKDNILIIRQIMAAKNSLEQLAVKILKEESKVCNRRRTDRILDIVFRLN